MPVTYKWATDALAPGVSGLDARAQWLAVPILIVLGYGVVRIVSTGLNQLRDALFAKVGQFAVRALANQTFHHLHQLSLRFHLQRRTGGLSRVIERGANGIETIVRMMVLSGIPTVVEFALTAGLIAWQYDWTYVGVIIVTTIAYVWFTVVASNWRIKIRKDMNDADTDSMSKAVDSLLNYETVKYFNNEELEIRRYDGATAKYEAAAVKTYTSLAWLNFGQGAIFSAGMAVVMIMSAYEVLQGRQTVGHFVMINALMTQLSMPLNFIGTLYREISQSLVDMDAMFTLLDEPAEVVDKPGAPALKVSDGAIRFEDVRFAYDPQRPILKGVSFEVPAGRTVAIVGPSGAGKSTISRLLFRFYDVGSGRITVDGQDIRDVSQGSLRRAIGMVPQDTVLFNDTIAYNIGYGRAGASEAEIAEAAEKAQIAGFVASLPDGFATEVGERGLKLSGGEKQRVAIARTILKAPPILISRRGDVGARHPHRTRDPGGARRRGEEPYDAGHRAPPVDGGQRRRDPRPEGRRRRRARPARDAPGARRPLRRHVGAPARRRRGARASGAGRRRGKGRHRQGERGRSGGGVRPSRRPACHTSPGTAGHRPVFRPQSRLRAEPFLLARAVWDTGAAPSSSGIGAARGEFRRSRAAFSLGCPRLF